jgi:hypothetical protein
VARGEKTIVTTLVLLLAATASSTAQPLPVPKTVCPTGYSSGSAYCTPVSPQSPRAIVKAGACPSGWADNGHYCVEVRPLR